MRVRLSGCLLRSLGPRAVAHRPPAGHLLRARARARVRVRVRARVRVRVRVEVGVGVRVGVRVPTTEAAERSRAVPSTSRVSPVMSDEESRCACWGEGAEGGAAGQRAWRWAVGRGGRRLGS